MKFNKARKSREPRVDDILSGNKAASMMAADADKHAENIKLTEEYHQKYPDSFSFQDWQNGEYSFEQRLLEHRLETIIGDCKELHDNRRMLYTAPDSMVLPQPLAFRPDTFKIPQFRADRKQCLDAISQVQFPEPHLFQADLLSEEVEAAGVPTITPALIPDMLMHFFEQRKERLIYKKCGLLARWARFCKRRDMAEHSQAAFRQAIERIDYEYDDASARLGRLEGALAAQSAQKIEQAQEAAAAGSAPGPPSLFPGGISAAAPGPGPTSEGAEGGAGAGGKKSLAAMLGIREISEGPAQQRPEGDLDPQTGLSPDDIQARTRPGPPSSARVPLVVDGDGGVGGAIAEAGRGWWLPAKGVCLRETVYSARASRRLNKFFSRLMWMTYTHRHDLCRRSVEILNNPKVSSPASRSSVTGGGAGPSAQPAPGLPMLIADAGLLDATLEQLGNHFDIHDSLSKAGGEEFCFRAMQKFAQIHAKQVAATTNPPYELCPLVSGVVAAGPGPPSPLPCFAPPPWLPRLAPWPSCLAPLAVMPRSPGRHASPPGCLASPPGRHASLPWPPCLATPAVPRPPCLVPWGLPSTRLTAAGGGAPASGGAGGVAGLELSPGPGTTFLKKASWRLFSAQPVISQTQQMQGAALMATEVDALLRMEMRNLEQADVVRLIQKAKEEAAAHVQRISGASEAVADTNQARPPARPPARLPTPAPPTIAPRQPWCLCPACPDGRLWFVLLGVWWRTLQNAATLERRHLTAAGPAPDGMLPPAPIVRGRTPTPSMERPDESEGSPTTRTAASRTSKRNVCRLPSPSGFPVLDGWSFLGLGSPGPGQRTLSSRKLAALFLLRHARTRELQQRVLASLNYFRSVQRRLALDGLGFPWDSEETATRRQRFTAGMTADPKAEQVAPALTPPRPGGLGGAQLGG
ncbi:hypothetical protein PAPYR_9468 [Paratrimastix pyriformis]|uniref:DUF4549 domain-containing protein n=1 Tax=Paratrimastix pyriformis TaxID=342808 RepID=A0ABQ8UAY0_9EUKA|nr:hypothetical protein PAPYR_9468 [Paratrimastix pyriformis]